jgi:hypothetical protein
MTKYKIGALLIFIMIGCLSLNTAKAQDESPKKWSYFNKNNITFQSAGNNDDDDKGLNLSTIHGVHLSDRFAAGIGVGITGGVKYPYTLIPVFLNGTLSLTQSRKLYLSADFGYSITTEKYAKGGPVGALAIGWKFRIGKIAIAPEIGYRFDGYRDRVWALDVSDDSYTYRPTNNYASQHINSFSTGISIFF